MKVDLDCAISELLQTQAELEGLAYLLKNNDPDYPLHEFDKKCILIRMYMLEGCIRFLEKAIMIEIDKVDIGPTFYTPRLDQFNHEHTKSH